MSLALLPILLACTPDAPSDPAATPGPATPPAVRELSLGAYTTPREAYGKAILPAFAASWKAKTGQTVTFQESYQGSGSQARAIVEGFEADVAALSLDPDVGTIEKAGLVKHDWRAGPHGGIVTKSIVVIAVRAGNPKGIKDWADLARDDIEVLTPNVRTSGGAMWNVAAIWGAATRGKAGGAAGDLAVAEQLLAGILGNVKVMDKGARESMVTFENGVGDAAITYENEVLVAKQEGKAMDYVVPTSTLLIENPVAVIDTNVDAHGTRDLAEAFVAFLTTSEAQQSFAKYGLRPVDETATPPGLPVVTDLFTVRDLGGWPAVQESLFAKGAAYDRALSAAQATK
ncbi:MAG: sulfate ABC transporter substrate-binding protein [Myxococcota bacterium]